MWRRSVHFDEANRLADLIRDQVDSGRAVRVLPVGGGHHAVEVEDPHGLELRQQFYNYDSFLWAEREDNWTTHGHRL